MSGVAANAPNVAQAVIKTTIGPAIVKIAQSAVRLGQINIPGMDVSVHHAVRNEYCRSSLCLSDLQAIGRDLSGSYCLAADIDASLTKDWDSGKGFATIGNEQNRFTGVLLAAKEVLSYVNEWFMAGCYLIFEA
jgi:hypothetical protein